MKFSLQFAIAFDAQQRRARQVVFFLVDGEFGFAHPFRHFAFVLFLFLLEQVLVGDLNRHLRLDLQKLVLHVENDLLDHLFRLLGLVDQVIEVGPD